MIPRIERKRIEPALWRKIHAAMPIICVDVAVMMGDEFLIVKRAIEPLKGQWFMPGGRLLRGEKLRDAVSRIVRAETGLRTISPSLYLGVREDFYDREPCGHGKGAHTVVHCFAVEVAGRVRLDRQSSDAQWVDLRDAYHDGGIHRYARELAGKALRKREPLEL